MNHGSPVVVHSIGWAFVIDKRQIMAWVHAGRPRPWYCGLLHRFNWWRVKYLQEFVCAICASDFPAERSEDAS